MGKWIWTVLACALIVPPALAQETETPPAEAVAEPQAEAAAEPAAEPTLEPAPAPESEPLAPEPVATIPVPPIEPEAQPKAEDGTRLDDLVVTATKRPQSVREIPVSINAVRGEQLEEMGAHELKDFISLIPGINVQDEIAGVQKKLAVRGVGPDTGGNQTVGIVFGDVPLSDPYGSYSIADPDPWDLATVEVLKGPQGTLFGATSLAGVIRYVPNMPELGVWNGRLSADWVKVTNGETEPTFGAVLNAPVGNTAALRLSGSWQHKPGLIDMENPSYEGIDVDDTYTRTGRAMALWQPLEELSLNLWYLVGNRESNELSYLTDYEGRDVRDDATAPSPVRNAYSLGNLDVRYEFDWATLVSVTGYQTKESFNDADASYLVRDSAEAGLRTVSATRNVETNGWLQELRLASPEDGGAWSWIIGGFYSTYEADVQGQLIVYPGAPEIGELLGLLPPEFGFNSQGGTVGTTTGFKPIYASETALFGEASYTFWDHWTATLGGRLYEAGVEGTRRISGASSESGELPLEAIGKGFSPKVALTWRWNDDFMVYANYSEGFQYGGFNVPLTIPVPPTFKSSTLKNHELGFRTDWFDRTLRFDLTGLYLLWQNPQVYQSTNPPLQGYVDNVGGSRSIGAETTIRWITPLTGLSFETAGSYIEAVTTEAFQDSGGTTVPAGTEMPSSPKVQTSSTLGYSLPLGEWNTVLALTHTYQGAAWNNIAHDVEVGDYELLHLALSVTRSDLPLAPTVRLMVNNLEDERALTSALGGSDMGVDSTPRPVVYTSPRTFRLNMTLTFY